MNLKNKQQINGNVLLINPAYVHLDNAIIEQPETAVFPFGLLYVGHLIEARGACVTYLDNQRTNITKIIKDYDYCGINVIGSQNIFTANRTYQELIKLGFPPDRILLGGQGIEGLSETEFNRVFPNALQFKTQDLAISGYWSVNISSQLDKFSDEDLEAYLKNELVIPFTQGCKHRCSFCSAANARKEQWYDASSNLETYFKKAREFEIYELTGYATALNFFQMAEKPETKKELKKVLKQFIDLQQEYSTNIRLRGMTRADSYVIAAQDTELIDLVKQAGFYQFGIGADGAVDLKLLKAINKKDNSLKSSIVEAFTHSERNGLIPEILYVFGTATDTFETLEKTEMFCKELMQMFETAIYRGFPAKDHVPGNRNWSLNSWKQSSAHDKLLEDPSLFLNLGYETLASIISHEDANMRKKVNEVAIDLSLFAHKLGRVHSYLTLPIMETDGHELMDVKTFEKFRKIASNYVDRSILNRVSLENLPEFRGEINKRIPRDI